MKSILLTITQTDITQHTYIYIHTHIVLIESLMKWEWAAKSVVDLYVQKLKNIQYTHTQSWN